MNSVENQLKNINITGGNGFVGKYLIDKLRKNERYRIKLIGRKKIDCDEIDENIKNVICDLLDKNSIIGKLDKGGTLIHLAYSWNDSEINNINATENIVYECINAGISRIIHISTAAVVGRVDGINIDEKTECNPISKYGKTKLAIEELLINKTKNSKIDLVILRPTSVYGIGGAPLFKLCGDLQNQNWVLNYLRCCLFGNRSMSLLHVENLINAIIFTINHQEKFNQEILIISEDDVIENNYIDIEKAIREEFKIKNYPLPIIKLPKFILNLCLRILNRNTINAHYKFNSNLIMNKYKIIMKKKLLDGIKEYAIWYRKKI